MKRQNGLSIINVDAWIQHKKTVCHICISYGFSQWMSMPENKHTKTTSEYIFKDNVLHTYKSWIFTINDWIQYPKTITVTNVNVWTRYLKNVLHTFNYGMFKW